MAKYRGKYKKCRDCKHAKEVMMYIVQTKESCPKHVNFSGTLAVDKPTCERCEYFEPKVGWEVLFREDRREGRCLRD